MRKLKLCLVTLLLLALIYLIPAIHNQRQSSYQSLSKTDQSLLSELNTFLGAKESSSIWKSYTLSDKSLLALNGRFGKGYLINPSEEVHSIFARKIQMPDDYSISVYRISPFAPQLLQFAIAGNFNTLHRSYMVYDNPVYFTKYNDDSVTLQHHSNHYISFLTHESFHYYMQNNWSDSGRFNTDSLTGSNLTLLGRQYQVLQKIYDALIEHPDSSDKAALQALAQEYVAVTKQRFQAAPDYMKEETQAETEEGSATYVELKASEIVGYDMQIMQFADKTDDSKVNILPFDAIAPAIKDGTSDSSVISTNIVYQSGALLCRLLDALDVPDWQDTLNQQTKKNPVTLYQLLSDYVHAL